MHATGGRPSARARAKRACAPSGRWRGAALAPQGVGCPRARVSVHPSVCHHVIASSNEHHIRSYRMHAFTYALRIHHITTRRVQCSGHLIETESTSKCPSRSTDRKAPGSSLTRVSFCPPRNSFELCSRPRKSSPPWASRSPRAYLFFPPSIPWSSIIQQRSVSAPCVCSGFHVQPPAAAAGRFVSRPSTVGPTDVSSARVRQVSDRLRASREQPGVIAYPGSRTPGPFSPRGTGAERLCVRYSV